MRLAANKTRESCFVQLLPDCWMALKIVEGRPLQEARKEVQEKEQRQRKFLGGAGTGRGRSGGVDKAKSPKIKAWNTCRHHKSCCHCSNLLLQRIQLTQICKEADRQTHVGRGEYRNCSAVCPSQSLHFSKGQCSMPACNMWRQQGNESKLILPLAVQWR